MRRWSYVDPIFLISWLLHLLRYAPYLLERTSPRALPLYHHHNHSPPSCIILRSCIGYYNGHMYFYAISSNPVLRTYPNFSDSPRA